MRKKVLIVVHDDHVEAYADDDVDVWIAHFPKVNSVKGEVLAEKYVAGTLPINYRSLYWPGKLRKEEVLSCPTPEEIADRKWQVEVLRSLDKAEEMLSTPF